MSLMSNQQSENNEIPDFVSKELLSELDSFIAYYIQRRRNTVVQAMVALRPDLIKMHNLMELLGLQNDEIDESVNSFRNQQIEGQVQQEGSWNNQWKYQLHGHGCELVNTQTSESFDWDVADPSIFFTGELLAYLKWITHRNPDIPIDVSKNLLTLVSTDLNKSLELLVQNDSLKKLNDNTWQFLGFR